MRVANSPVAWDARASAVTAWDAALWSEHGQTSRFEAVLMHLPLESGDTLLDFGCGAGRLADFLKDDVRYHAHDWSFEMRERCKREHPRAVVLEDVAVGMKFDHVVAVGPFNLKDGWWKERTWQTLAELWRVARKSLAVSVYRGEDPACLSYSAVDLLAMCRRVDCTAFLIDGSYLENDLLLVMHR